MRGDEREASYPGSPRGERSPRRHGTQDPFPSHVPPTQGVPAGSLGHEHPGPASQTAAPRQGAGDPHHMEQGSQFPEPSQKPPGHGI